MKQCPENKQRADGTEVRCTEYIGDTWKACRSCQQSKVLRKSSKQRGWNHGLMPSAAYKQ